MNKYFLAIVASLFLLISCDRQDMSLSGEATTLNSSINEVSLKKNVAVLDLVDRSLDSKSYVKEFHFLDVNSLLTDKSVLVYKGFTLTDDGSFNDEIAGDGVYTSVDLFFHNIENPYNEFNTIKSRLEQPIFDPTFSQFEALGANLKNHHDLYSSNNLKVSGVGVSCPIKFGTNGCNAEKLGLCTNCCFTIDFDNCTLEISFP